MALTDKLSAIADAIRAKTGKNAPMTLEQMPGEISGITGGGSAAGCVTVTFMNGDTVLFSRPVYIGDDCPDPITQGHIATTPTKESSAQYDYTYSGWCAADGGTADSAVLENITEDTTIYAAYTTAVRYYTITFYDDDGTTVLATKEVAYGSKPTYTATKDGCILTGWTPELAAVTGEASYVAVWGTVLVVIPEQTVKTTSSNGNGTYGTVTGIEFGVEEGATYQVTYKLSTSSSQYQNEKVATRFTIWYGNTKQNVYLGIGDPWKAKQKDSTTITEVYLFGTTTKVSKYGAHQAGYFIRSEKQDDGTYNWIFYTDSEYSACKFKVEKVIASE